MSTILWLPGGDPCCGGISEKLSGEDVKTGE